VSKRSSGPEPASGKTFMSTLNNVFFLIVLLAMVIGGVFLAIYKL
jgi:hypothetical protein